MEKTLAFALLLWLIPCAVTAQENETRALFSRAYSLFNQKQLGEAEPLFLQALQDSYVLSDYALYFLGQIASARGTYDWARHYLAQLKERFPESVWVLEGDLQLAKISLAEKDYARCRQELQPLVRLKHRSEIACEARYLLGQMYQLQGDASQAYSVYQDLRRTLPLCARAESARKEVLKLQEEHSQLSLSASYERLWEEGELLLRQRQWGAAEETFQKLLQLFPDESLRPRSLMGLARVYDILRRREEQMPILGVIANKYAGSPEAPLALLRLATIHWNRDENEKALVYFKRLIERYPQSPVAETAYIAVARIYQSLGQTKEAIKRLLDFSRKFPASRLREEAHWRLGWIYYAAADYKRAHGTFKNLAESPGSDRYRLAALYWRGRTAERLGQQDEAKKIYLEIVRRHEESYYAWPARQRLAAIGAGGENENLAPKPSSQEPVASPTARFSFHVARARELAELSLNSLALVELDEIRGEATDTGLTLVLIREYARIGAYNRSVPLASQTQLSSDETKAHRYPLAYWDLVQRKAEERGLDPYLILALMRQESLFDPHAVSPAHALGLMQLLPSTAARLARQLGMPEPTPEKLYDPELNVTLGTHYLKELHQRYSNDPVKALAAYNAGERVVARWEREISTSDPEEFIERMTYGETLQYVKLVLRAHRLYTTLYSVQK